MNQTPLTFAGKLQSRIGALLDKREERERKISRSLASIDRLPSHPTSPVRAILWLFGRPWEGSPVWPNCFPYPLSIHSRVLPSASVPSAKTRLTFSSLAIRRWWLFQAQLSILSHEILSRLAGRCGKDQLDPTCPLYSKAQIDALREVSSRELEAIYGPKALPRVSGSYGSPLLSPFERTVSNPDPASK